MRIIVVIASIWVFGQPGFAQNFEQVCAKMLEGRFIDTYDRKIWSEIIEDDYHYACDSRSSSEETGSSLSVSLEGLLQGFYGEDINREKFKNSCREDKERFFNSLTRVDRQQVASNLLDRVNTCLELAADANREMIAGQIEPSISDDSRFVVNAYYKSGSQNSPYRLVNIELASEDDVECFLSPRGERPPAAGVGDIVVRNEIAFTCTKPAGRDVAGTFGWEELGQNGEGTGQMILVPFKVLSRVANEDICRRAASFVANELGLVRQILNPNQVIINEEPVEIAAGDGPHHFIYFGDRDPDFIAPVDGEYVLVIESRPEGPVGDYFTCELTLGRTLAESGPPLSGDTFPITDIDANFKSCRVSTQTELAAGQSFSARYFHHRFGRNWPTDITASMTLVAATQPSPINLQVESGQSGQLCNVIETNAE